MAGKGMDDCVLDEVTLSNSDMQPGSKLTFDGS